MTRGRNIDTRTIRFFLQTSYPQEFLLGHRISLCRAMKRESQMQLGVPLNNQLTVEYRHAIMPSYDLVIQVNHAGSTTKFYEITETKIGNLGFHVFYVKGLRWLNSRGLILIMNECKFIIYF